MCTYTTKTIKTSCGRENTARQRDALPERGYTSAAPAGRWTVEGIPGSFDSFEEALVAIQIDAMCWKQIEEIER